jgi:hypothetical protein
VCESVSHDAGHVVLAQRIGDLAVFPHASHHPGMPQNPQVLRDMRLGQAGELYQLMDVAAGVAQVQLV